MSQRRQHHPMLGLIRQLVMLTLLPVTAVAGDVSGPSGPARLDNVEVTARADAAVVLIKTSSPAKYRTDLIDSPTRLVIDFSDTTFAWRPSTLDVGKAPLRQIRGSQFRSGVSRVVIEFSEPADYVVRQERDGLAVLVGKRGTNAKLETAPAIVAREAAAPAQLAVETSVPAVVPLADTPTVDRAPRLVAQAPVTPPRPPAPTITSGSSGRLISFDFKDADVVNLLRILAAESGKNIVISDDVKGKMSLTLRNVPWEQALEIILEARGLERVERGNVIRIVTRDQLQKERESLARIEEARVKAEEAKSKADVEIRTKAAEAVLKEQEAQQKKLAAEAALAEQLARGPLREETIRLAYADPDEVVKTLQGLLGSTGGEAAVSAAPIIPPAGPPFSALYSQQPGAPPATPTAEVLAKGITIRAHKPTNSIFIRHYDKDLERIKKLIREQLDVQLPQIKIEARMNELSRRDLFDIGVSWSGAGFLQARNGRNVLTSQGINPGGGAGNVFAPAPTTIPAAGAAPVPVDRFTQGTTGVPFGGLPVQPLLPVSGISGLPLGGNIVNLPTSLAAPTAGIGFGIIGTRFSLNFALQALESLSKTRSLSRPEIVTVENGKASISLGSEIPYATVSSAGTQVQFKEAVLKLEVTPTVVREPDVTKIKMKVIIEDNSRGIDVPSGSLGGTLPTINKRRAETEVVVKEGESLVVGGIGQRSEATNVNKVPLLGDVPVLGWLFKSKSVSIDPDRELVVFITPSVLRDAPRGTGPSTPPAR